MARRPERRVWTTESPDETRGVGEEIGRNLSGGEIITLIGDLGAGKTTLAQGIARGAGVQNRYVTSPTFALINSYTGRVPFYHIDLYRLKTASDVEALGLLDLISEKAVAVVEWPEAAEDLLPEERLRVTLTPVSESVRKISVSGEGERYAKLVQTLERT
jgi:tRNA threonylcarbamoyladenosine biosynthesis protein TsaE